MKKTYETPSVEKIAFKYRDQVVVASNGSYICHIEHNYGAAGKGNEACLTGSEWLSDHE